MQRRGESGQPVKGQSANRPEARNAPTAPASADHSAEQFDRLKRERDEALERETAAADILRVIASSPGNTQPVFDAIVQSGLRLFPQATISIAIRDGELVRAVAVAEPDPARAEAWIRQFPNPLRRDYMHGRAILDGKMMDFPDVEKAPADLSAGARNFLASGYRAVTIMPMIRNDVAIGALSVVRLAPGPLSDKQREVLRTFAAQAVIAIENTRLLSELRKSLQQQTATADVLKVISSSPGELEPIFNAMLESAVRICQAKFGVMHRFVGEEFYAVAQLNLPQALDEFLRKRGQAKAIPGSDMDNLYKSKQVVHTIDMLATPVPSPPARLAGGRTQLAVPMIMEGELIGAIVIYRQEVRPFTDKQIELVTNFAAQAVIAIENTRLLNELRQSLEQQTATAEVLGVISSSTGELTPVFESMLENATRICGAKFGAIFRSEDHGLRLVATHNVPPAYAEVATFSPFRPSSRHYFGRMMATKSVIHVADVAAEPLYIKERYPPYVAAVELGGVRTFLAVPMLKENELIGAILVARQEVRPFTDKQVELVTNFAAQAVIAIENTRLLNELRESLQQQTASAEVLKVISSSPGELEPVFQAMLANAVRICEAKFGGLVLFEGNAYRRVALHNAPAAYVEAQAQDPVRPLAASPTLSRVAGTKQVIHIADIHVDQPEEAIAVLGGARTILCVPMLKDDQVVGVISIYRQEVRPFTDKQVELVSNFAAQAVIAIENTRLLNELRESLQQQTATSEVLSIISSSAGELQHVFETMLARATELCEASYGAFWLRDGDGYRFAALFGDLPNEYEEHRRNKTLIRVRPEVPLARIAVTRQPVQVADLRTDPSYLAGDPLPVSAVNVGGIRTLLVVPMFKEGELIGAIAIYRKEVRPFTDKQVDLVSNFGAQAVIAIENTRLLSDLRESLQQQTATADVLKVISRSTFDLQTVLQTLVKSAARFCNADKANVIRERNGAFYSAESYGFSRELVDYLRDIPIETERGTASGRALLEGRVVHITDVKSDPEYTLVEGQRLGDYRTILSVPMLREGVPIGVLTLLRSEIRPFTDRQIELVTTFADQAAIAIENVRLFESVETRTRELAASLENLRTTQDRLVQTQKLASLGQLTAGIAHEIKNPLNFVNNFSGVSAELIDELQEAFKDVSLNEKRRGEITELMNTLRSNLDKVMQHGKRADAIVKNMLLHSREGSGEHRVVDINALVEESLNLAYHGARAEKQGFTITLERSLDPAAGAADVFPQDITRALLNLISNGFYAATKRKTEVNGGDYEPTLTAATKNLGDRVEIRIRDNGTGIPPDVKEKMFNPFFTTKPAGEGTGLGLSISHDIIVKQHGGSIEVDTQPGKFTELRIVLPRAAVFLVEPGRRA